MRHISIMAFHAAILFCLGTVSQSAFCQELAAPTGPVATLGATAPGKQDVAETSTALTGVVGDVASKPVSTPRHQPRSNANAGAKAPPAVLRVASNANTKFAIALYHVNRIITPFRDPEIQTSSTAGISVDRGIVNVVADREDPIGLFIYDRSEPTQALSLTLLPTEISPVSVRVDLEGWTQSGERNVSRAGDGSLARTWETEEPYIATLKELFKGLALGKIPDGYGLRGISGQSRLMPVCNLPGLEVMPMQILDGFAVTAIVAKVTNRGQGPVEINESACKSTDLLAVAAWPQSRVNPGESVELYVAVRTPDDSAGQQERPSVIATGR